MTQAELAEQAEIGQAHLSRVERAADVPSLDALQRLARALSVSAAHLLAVGERRPHGLHDEVVALLEGCDEDRLRLTRDFLLLLRRVQ